MLQAKAIVATLIIIACVASCGRKRRSPDTSLRISAAASLIDVMGEIADLYRRQTGVTCELNFSASSILARQIAQGHAADLLVSANPDWVEYLDRKGLLAPDGVSVVAGNSLVVVIPANSNVAPARLRELAGKDFRRIALADPSHAPAGMYARAALEEAGVWAELEGRVVGAVDVRAALAFVEEGTVNCGIVYRSDALNSDRVSITFTVPDGENRITFVGAVTTHGAQAGDEAYAFLRFLSSSAAQAVFAKHGFEKGGTR